MNKKRLGIFLGSIALLIVCSFAAYQYWLAPTRILIINATLAQAADIALNNDCTRIEVTCIKKEEVKDLSGYDAIVMYSRGLYLDDGQIAEVERVGASGVPVFTNTLRNFTLSLNHNVTTAYATGVSQERQQAQLPECLTLPAPHRHSPPVGTPGLRASHPIAGEHVLPPRIRPLLQYSARGDRLSERKKSLP